VASTVSHSLMSVAALKSERSPTCKNEAGSDKSEPASAHQSTGTRVPAALKRGAAAVVPYIVAQTAPEKVSQDWTVPC
jgi:hypothetical protein